MSKEFKIFHANSLQELLRALWRDQGVICDKILEDAKKRFIDSRAPELPLSLPPELMQEVSLRCQALYQMQRAIKEALSHSFTIHASRIFALVRHQPFPPTLEKIKKEIYWTLRIVCLHLLPPTPAEQEQLQFWLACKKRRINMLLFPIADCAPLFSFGDLFFSQLGMPEDEAPVKEFEHQRCKDPHASHNEIVTRTSNEIIIRTSIRVDPSRILLFYKWWWFSLKRSRHSALESAIQWSVTEVLANHGGISADEALALVKKDFEEKFPLLPFEENHAKTRIVKPLPLPLPDGAEEERQKKELASLVAALSLKIDLDPVPPAEVLKIPETNGSQKQAQGTTQELSPP